VTTVLVIGGGIAGLSAARALCDNGIGVRIIEARDRLGGRVHSLELAGFAIELGAFLLHGLAQNPLRPLLETGKPISRKMGNTRYLLPPGLSEATVRADRAQLADLYAGMNPRPGNLAEALREAWRAAPPHPAMARWFFDHLAQVEGADPDALDCAQLLANAEEGGNGMPEGGLSRIIAPLAEGLDTSLGEVATHIDWRQRSVRVTTSKETHEAEIVLVTLPLGILTAGSVVFEPPLPEFKYSALETMRMGLLEKIHLVFEKPFWDTDRLTLIHESEPSLTFVALERTRPVSTVFIGGRRAWSLAGRGEAEITADLMTRLREHIPDAPDPIAAHVTRWGRDPFTRGGYSYLAPGSIGDEPDRLAEPLGERLFFAGEHTIRPCYATVHGAYLSGLREADRITRVLSSS